MELRGDEPLLDPGLGQRDPPGGGVRGRAVAEPVDVKPAEVVAEPLALAAPGEGHDGPIAGPGELLELRFGLLETARGDVGGLGAERVGLVLIDARQPHLDPRSERRADLRRVDVQVAGVLVVDRCRDVLPVIGERRLEVLGARDRDRGLLADQVQQRMEILDGQQLGDVRPVGGLLERRDLSQLAVFGGELGRGRDLDALGISERALGEGREPTQ